MLRAEELMVGDWVYCEGQPTPDNVIIQSIHEDGVWFQGEEFEGAASYDRIFPIPLTPEILEKSGWKHDPSVQRAMINTNFQRNNYLAMAWDSKSHVLNMSVRRDCDINIPCEYVHILQHALRLCGIDKTIEL